MAKLIDNFLADSSLETLTAPQMSSHYILWGGFIFMVVGVIWAHFAVLDEVSSGEGKVIPSSQVQIIQNLEGGILQEILVQEGDIVKKGQVLMLLDDTRFASSYNEGLAKIASLQARLQRLRSEASGENLVFSSELSSAHPDIIENEKSLYQSRKREFENKIEGLKAHVGQSQQELEELKVNLNQSTRSLDLVNQELNLTKPLLEDGAVSQVEVLRLERQSNDLYGEIEATKIAMLRAKQAISEANNKLEEARNGFQANAADEIARTKAELSPLLESASALEDRVKRTTIRSSVDGTIKNININTIGGVIQPGMDLIEVVPLNDTLLIEARIKPSDIGFIRPGQKANVKITAYDYSIYGGLPATVEHISADTIKDEKDENYYEIRVRTQKALIDKSGKPLTIIPGMMATVDIMTGEKTVLDYLLKPILKAKQNALRER